jgi:aspartate/methionine/tyrosine aminotransferase
MPEGAINEAEEKGITVDTLYALSLLESTGICVVPASGFGQMPGNRHGFRTTFLPPENEMERAVGLFKKHHEDFCARYDSVREAAGV